MPMHKGLVVTSAGLLLAAAMTSAHAEPVYVGGDPNYDACSVEGAVHGLDPSGDNFLAVRDGPGTQHRMIDKLASGARLFICSDRGSWRGVVYGRGDCGVSTPIHKRSAYSGPCRAGWVHRSYVREVAG